MKGFRAQPQATLYRQTRPKGCPIKAQCIGKSPELRITITAYRAEYERAIERVRSPHGRKMKTKRSSTVEPVFGVLTQYMGLRRMNTRGIDNASKCMLAAAMAYNLKKWLNHTTKQAERVSQKAQQALLQLIVQIGLLVSPNPLLKI